MTKPGKTIMPFYLNTEDGELELRQGDTVEIIINGKKAKGEIALTASIGHLTSFHLTTFEDKEEDSIVVDREESMGILNKGDCVLIQFSD